MLWYRSDDRPRVFVSVRTLRIAVGILGAFLPFFLIATCFVVGGCGGLQQSVSHYYGTHARDVFVGILFAIAWFLFAYRGYEARDDLFGDVACVLALLVALFPTTSGSTVIARVHLLSAAGLFLVLAYFSMCLFTKGQRPFTPEKEKRNVLYRVCGVVMLTCIGAIAVYFLWLEDSSVAALKPVFWLETIALAAFGLSWFTKGETLLKDAAADAATPPS